MLKRFFIVLTGMSVLELGVVSVNDMMALSKDNRNKSVGKETLRVCGISWRIFKCEGSYSER